MCFDSKNRFSFIEISWIIYFVCLKFLFIVFCTCNCLVSISFMCNCVYGSLVPCYFEYLVEPYNETIYCYWSLLNRIDHQGDRLFIKKISFQKVLVLGKWEQQDYKKLMEMWVRNSGHTLNPGRLRSFENQGSKGH